jgi:hypothetical protein
VKADQIRIRDEYSCYSIGFVGISQPKQDKPFYRDRFKDFKNLSFRINRGKSGAKPVL